MKMKKLHKSLFFYLMLLAFLPVGFSASAQEEMTKEEILKLVDETVAAQEREHERFQLWNDCKPMNLVVGTPLSPSATKIGLREDDITTAVRSRLRAARLYSDGLGLSEPYLYVAVNVSGAGFSVSINLNKKVLDSANNVSGFATTWKSGITGTYGQQNEVYVMSAVSQETDRFIDQYLRVNESSCK